MQEQGRDEASAPGILELWIPKSCSEIESAGTAEHMFAMADRDVNRRKQVVYLITSVVFNPVTKPK
jgi:hypothetical protein